MSLSTLPSPEERRRALDRLDQVLHRSRQYRRRRRLGTGLAALVVLGLAIGLPLTLIGLSAPNTQVRVVGTPKVPRSANPVACGAVIDLAVPDGTTVTTTVTLGATTATLTATRASSPQAGWFLAAPTLTVVTSGQTLISVAVTPPQAGPGDPIDPYYTKVVIPMSIAPQAPPTIGGGQMLCLARFAGDNQPTALLGLYTGYATCCSVVRAYPLPSGVATGPAEIDAGRQTATVTPYHGAAVVVTADNAFACQFVSCAASGAPIEVLELRHGTLQDTTREHLDLVLTDAASWWNKFTLNDPHAEGGLGLLAPWVADECLLGRQAQAWTTVDQLQAGGRLAALSPSGTNSGYVQELHAFLSKHGYCQA